MYYHGTAKDRGNRILKKQKMEYSRNTPKKEHWLGNGIYLYRDRLYSFRWIVLMYEERHNYQNIKDELFHKYSILGVELDYDNERVFRPENPEHLMVFEHVKEQCEKKQKYSKKISDSKFADGVIFNIMFKELGYSSKYDLIEYSFSTSELDSNMQKKSRIKTVRECQLCVKNPDIVKNIIDVSEEFPLEEYLVRYKEFNKFKNASGSRYGKSGKYGKWKNSG